MYLYVKSAILVLAFTTCYAYAHEQSVPRQLKSENDLIISWEPLSTDARANQVDISDEQGHPVAGLNVLGLVPDALRVSIYDVSAHTPVIAVAAVYESKQGNRQVRPTASLLLFNFNGQLLSAFALEPSHAIARLAVDDKSNIWTLTEFADTNVDPSTVPMVVEYTAEGRIARELLTRNMFPFHASDLREDPEIGAAAMGYDAGVVWFWLPGSTDFVSITTSNGKIAMVKTQLPKKAGRNAVPLSIAREPSGNLVAQVGENDEQGKRVIAHYTWSPATAWLQFKPTKCEGNRLIGIGDKGQIYHSYQGDHTEVCIFRSRD